MIDKILKYFDNKKIIIIALCLLVVYGAFTSDITNDIILIALGGLIGYLTPKI
jgi:hypothetical protein